MYLALLDHGATPVTDQTLDLFPLSQITSNIFCDISRDGKDALSISLYMTKKLISQIDPDDDDELGELTEILSNALIADSEAHVLDLFKDAGLDFTVPLHYLGDILCLRDECLRCGYGIGVVRKLAELGVDMDQAVVRGRTPAFIMPPARSRMTLRESLILLKRRGFSPRSPWSRLPTAGRRPSISPPNTAILAC